MAMSMEELERREAELAAREAALQEREAALEQVENLTGEKPKGIIQEKKESLYDKIPLTVHQLDIIIAICVILLLGIFATGIFHIDPLALLRGR